LRKELLGKRTCKVCLRVLNHTCFYRKIGGGLNNKCKTCFKKSTKEYRDNNKEKVKEYHKTYALNNKDKIAVYKKEHYKENKERIEIYRNNWRTIKSKNDSLFKLTNSIRTRIKQSFRRNGFTKNSKTFEILGCTFDEFKAHLERQFTKGMNWDNLGEWHLDHIYPVSLSKDDEELIKLNHYTNFQPLWAIDNMIKGNKIIDNKQLKLI